MKKFIIILVSAIFFLGLGSGKTMAADYYAGTYASGLHAYVMTDTIVMWVAGFGLFVVIV